MQSVSNFCLCAAGLGLDPVENLDPNQNLNQGRPSDIGEIKGPGLPHGPQAGTTETAGPALIHENIFSTGVEVRIRVRTSEVGGMAMCGTLCGVTGKGKETIDSDSGIFRSTSLLAALVIMVKPVYHLQKREPVIHWVHVKVTRARRSKRSKKVKENYKGGNGTAIVVMGKSKTSQSGESWTNKITTTKVVTRNVIGRKRTRSEDINIANKDLR